MITKVALESFKRFDRLELTFGQLTVLTGGNASGKTSLIHALLLARQSALGRSRAYVELNGIDGLQLGEAGAVIHYGSTSTSILVTEDSDAVWQFDLPDDDRALGLMVAERPAGYVGVLSQSAPAFAYLCAERWGPRDSLGVDSVAPRELGVGVHGQFSAQVLATGDRHRVDPGRVEPSSGRLPQLLAQTEAWMSQIVRPVEIKAEWSPGTSVTTLRFKSPGAGSTWTRPANTGFGLSYVLPIVVAALHAPKGGLLIVENPEAHLHPAGQSAMGEFLARMASTGLQVLVETHSDHVVNGIRRCVAEKASLLAPTDVRVHYFYDNEDRHALCESIDVLQTGQLSRWPPGFFDQTQRDLAALARAQRKPA